jgi:peptidoglycan/xylan/chitin deacetylase (PgdA/CDA1 family)
MSRKLENYSRKVETNAAASFPTALKQMGRTAITGALYHGRLLAAARRLAGHFSLQKMPRLGLSYLRRDSQQKFGILCYHRVGTQGLPLYSRLRPETFEAQMCYLKSRYRLVSLGQLCRELRDARPVPPTLAITFDDGYRDLYEYAFPVLQKYGIPATIYLIGRCMQTGEAPWYDRIYLLLHSMTNDTLEVDLESPRRFSLTSTEARFAVAWELIGFLRSISEDRRQVWCEEMERRFPIAKGDISGCMLNWDQVREMRRGGLDFGAHTMTHPAISRLEPTDFPEELTAPKRLLEQGLQEPILDFAYPFGKRSDLSRAAQKFIADCGYRSAVTTMEGYNSSGANPFELRRMQVGDGRSLAKFSFDICRMFLRSREDSEPVDISLEQWHGNPLDRMPPREVV